METSQLNYHLPTELIAQSPAPGRDDSKLLVLKRATGEIIDSRFAELADYLRPDDCLVLNDTKVLQGRFFARRKTGAAIEALFLERAGERQWLVMLKNARRIKIGERICLFDRAGTEYCDAIAAEKLEDGRWLLRIESDADFETVLDKIGFAPLPPYIKRPKPEVTGEQDSLRYQTVYADCAGAVAAPTAGLHFTDELLAGLKEKGLSIAYLTLHVGAGTFKPVTAEDLKDHRIHSEKFSIDEKNAAIINQARQAGRRIIAVGTTSVRTLETLGISATVSAGAGATNLFIMPGFEFKITDAIITNFHLPKSTLLALVAAFAGLETVKAAYRHAIEQRYRFYSFGDAMLII